MTHRTTQRNFKKQFDAIVRGSQTTTLSNYSLILESIYTRLRIDPASIQRLAASDSGIACLQNAISVNLTPAFLDTYPARLVSFLGAPVLKAGGFGHYVEHIVKKLVEPPIFWRALTEAFVGGQLQDDGKRAFGWLLLQLVNLPAAEAQPYRELAREKDVLPKLIDSPDGEVRALGHKLKHTVEIVTSPCDDMGRGPGGRHDNDHVDFRKINIMPTADEILSKEVPFMRTAAEVDNIATEQRFAAHLDNQFRLYREDMLHNLKEELQIALGMRTGRRRGHIVENLALVGMHGVTGQWRNDKWGIVLRMSPDDDLWFFRHDTPQNRKKYLKNDQRLVRDGSMAALVIDSTLVAFPTIRRDEGRLSKKPPEFCLLLDGEQNTSDTLHKLVGAQDVRLVLIDTAVFSYEPILKALQQITSMPLAAELVQGGNSEPPPDPPASIIDALRQDPEQTLEDLIGLPMSTALDERQARALIFGLTRRLAMIQGPPGTGKTFTGALIAKIFHDRTDQKILVCCHTNHALDQFLDHLLGIGIPPESIIRMGRKTTSQTESLSLHKQKLNSYFTPNDWAEIDCYKSYATESLTQLRRAFSSYMEIAMGSLPGGSELMAYLEFADADFHDAFMVSNAGDVVREVEKEGQSVTEAYLLERWLNGQDAGVLRTAESVRQASFIWQMPNDERRAYIKEWRDAIISEHIQEVYDLGKAFNDCQDRLSAKFAQRETSALLNKRVRIVGCTTTAAAKHSSQLRHVLPDILLVEEAGEILESHILTALGERTQRLVLIGDHKQLRPKLSNHALSVERGSGHDLNRSLFERLIRRGYPHVMLTEQHRMRPEISSYVRRLTYPDLIDGASTQNRPSLRGVQDNVVFITHDHPEDGDDELDDQRDEARRYTKQNKYEVEIVLKILWYLAKNGYGTDKIVILTPYLGQLHRLREALQKEASTNPVLNDLDSYDLVRAGLMTAAAAKLAKRSVRLATIDNFQGEESEIVLVSLTRSNSTRDIGFMSAPERLNVLLSRARNGLIMIGNNETFSTAKHGGELWTRFLNMLRVDGHVYSGFPARCERHPKATALLKAPGEFEEWCPEGGCREPCAEVLSCGRHQCPSKCHRLPSHSKMKCEAVMEFTCPNNHKRMYLCHQPSPSVCEKCQDASELAHRKRRKDFEEQHERNVRMRLHARQMQAIDNEIEEQRAQQRAHALEQQFRDAIIQKQRDLDNAKTCTAGLRVQVQPTQVSSSRLAYLVDQGCPYIMTTSTPPTNPGASSSSTPTSMSDANACGPQLSPYSPATPHSVSEHDIPPPLPPSNAEQEWQRQKDVDGADNQHIDAIMTMTGLEKVKEQVLRIKAKIDTSKRQGTSVSDERFNIALLGNPGTGKTTVARHYAKFLVSIGVLPNDKFWETTGSRLASDGVREVKKQLDDMLDEGGGAIFIDEAYQLTGPHNFNGDQVLDFLLAEMENNVGKLVFILAGYNKEMEKFFEHNPGIPSRVPYTLQFTDFEDAELLVMLDKHIQKKYQGRMEVECGAYGLYMRIAVRRLGRGRGRAGFGNARALQNMFNAISERQAMRLTAGRKEGKLPNDFLFTKEDIIGPDPSKALVESKAWVELHSLTGLEEVKQSIRNQFDLIEENYKRELAEKNPIQMTLNRVFLGNPGTGKTTVAKLYGRILADLGLLSNGEVVVKNPADFIGGAVGVSEQNTKGILAATIGKVLVIDEAYSLYGGGQQGDSYRTAVVDTIVGEVQSTLGEDRCVLMCGYEPQMREMFQNVNPGLSRRFAIEDAFRFSDFTDSELLDILDLKLKQQDLHATPEAKTVAIDVLSRSRARPHFGNGGEVDNMLNKAKNNHRSRQSKLPQELRTFDVVFEPVDFDPDFDRADNSGPNLLKLFEDVVGRKTIVDKLESYQSIALRMKQRGMSPQETRQLIPTNLVFKGPPGTGKTTTARKMGQVYYDMGFLSSAEVIECSASDLVGQYVGQTGPKTKRVFERALGKVLFIDEAYRLGEGQYAKEAMDELVGILTQEAFAGKLVVIIAGYDKQMNALLATNPGLASRFTEEVRFDNLTPANCLEILRKDLSKNEIDCPSLRAPDSNEYREMTQLVAQLSALDSWGNARDMKTLAKQVLSVAYKQCTDMAPGTHISLPGQDCIDCIEAMLRERSLRATNLPSPSRRASLMNFAMQQLGPPTLCSPPVTAAAHAVLSTSRFQEAEPQGNQGAAGGCPDGRDPGVSDAVWAQLQVDKQAAFDMKCRVEAELEWAAREAAHDEAARERLEELRQKALEEERKEEEAQAKIRRMGTCQLGYAWVKQAGGYRCEGGTLWLSNVDLGL